MTRVVVALFNIQSGCLLPAGGYDFRRLQRAAADLDAPASLWLINEAKMWRADANVGLHGAAEALSDALGLPYVGVLGTCPRGPIPPAIIYDPTVLVLRSWWNPDDPYTYADKLNVARFAVRDTAPDGSSRAEFLAWVDHWHPDSGTIRRQEAARLARYGRDTHLPVIGGGDLNANASGPHLPQRDWSLASHQRRSAEARRLPDGTWVADTDAVDHLLGSWGGDSRVGGCGHHAIAELAWRAGSATALVPTVNNNVDSGGAIIKDWLVANPAMVPHVDPHSYCVHIPSGDPVDWPSDHRLVTAAFDLAEIFAPLVGEQR
ncbi:hypothetical protein [Actinoplanes sp. NPDC049316]|uniref:hypothetical protein n=1 Tax=Actinoplanes sp. NPDC049316 TaxID=3154727 RepID=UPI0034267714